MQLSEGSWGGVYPRLLSWAPNAIIMALMKEGDHTPLPHTPKVKMEAEIGVNEVKEQKSLSQAGRAGNGSPRGSCGSLSPLTPLTPAILILSV